MTRRAAVVVLLALLAVVRGDAQSGCTGGPVTWNATATRAAIAQCVANADDGDTIIIAAGTADFGASVAVLAKAITIRGGGPGVTTLRDTQTTAGGEGHLFVIGVPASGTFALRDVTIEEQTGTQGGMIQVYGSGAGFWMDNIIWEYRRYGRTLTFYGYVRGVLSRLDMRFHDRLGDPIVVQHDNWGGSGYFGDNSWFVAPTMGTAEALYIEDSKFTCGPEVGYCANFDAHHGARIVLRFSELIGPQYMRHGMGTTGNGNRARGTAQTEIYRNYAHDYRPDGYHHPFPWGSGWGVEFENVAANLNTSTIGEISNLRAMTHDIQAGHRPYAFGNCEVLAITSISCSGGVASIAAPYMSGHAGQWIQIVGNSVGAYNGPKAITSPADLGFTHQNPVGQPIQFAAPGCTVTGTGGTMQSPFDGNAGASGYYCTDQPGRGPGRLLSGGSANSTLGSGSLLTDTSPSAQILLPLYQWSDTLNGSPAPLGISGYNDTGDLATNRDYFFSVGASCTGGGACTTGVGSGTTLPTTCEANVGGVTGAAVAFWKTNEGSWNQETAAQHATHAGATHTLNQHGRLYRCGGTAGATGLAGTTDNSWVVFYEPYTYPHPLRSGGPVNTTPSATISTPANYANVTAATVDLAGNCVDDEGCTGLTWVNSNGGATTPLATLTGQAWTIASAAVAAGVNTFTVTGTDVGGGKGTASTSILRRAVVSALPFTDDCSSSIAWPTPGPHYTRYGSTAAYLGLSGTGTCVVNAAAFEGYAFTGFPLNTDHYIKVRLVTVAPMTRQLRLCVNMTGTQGQTSDFNAYFIQIDGTNSASNLIGRYTGGAFDLVYASGIAGVNVAPGITTVEARKAGTRLSLYIDGDEKTPGGVEVGSGFTGGTAGLCSYGVGTEVDDIEIGNTTVTSDTTPPDVDIAVPTPDASYNTSGAETLTTLSGTWTDAVGVATCSYTVNTTPGAVAMTVGGGTFANVAAVPIAIGQNMIVVTCLDAAGNPGTDTLGVFRDPRPEPQDRPVNLRGIFIR